MSLVEEDMAKLAMIIASNQANGVATFNAFRNRVPTMVHLDAGDLAPSTPRNPEPMWHQIFRNIKSHSTTPGNAIYDGRLEHIPRVGYRITNHGRGWLAANP
ncbi:hypothetical protein [Sphingomonas glacialis]|uniref:hypothetical protein n=1 Tax=Sphingomonas glacialis TaxID=658225 RepID=UPI001125F2F4|nr:hypothetical protein [Sphingomonas glacialis]